jgi:hypothetical protein
VKEVKTLGNSDMDEIILQKLMHMALVSVWLIIGANDRLFQ